MSSRRSAVLVAAGMLCSRLAGLVRTRVFSHYFGLQSDSADAFNAAFRIPNFLQNLFGEGALSGSFIPVYAALVARGERREADRVAGAVASLLALVVSALVLVGVVATPLLISVIAPGFTGDKRALTIALVRILFPGAGLLVLSAWCLGVLNSHQRFLLSYAAPVMWNAAMIAALLAYGAHTSLPRLAVALAWGAVAGSALQLAVQVPVVWRVAPDLRFGWDLSSGHVRLVSRNFAPVFGLLASTLGRLYSSAYYALRDTRTPLRYAIVRVVLTTVLGYLFAIPLPHWIGLEPLWGAAGLTASAGIAGWVEMLLLRRTLNARIGRTGLPADYVLKLWAAAGVGAAAAWAAKIAVPTLQPVVTAVLVLGPYGVVFFGAAFVFRIPEASAALGRFARPRR